MEKPNYSNLMKDKILLERSRLLILSYITGSEFESATFMELQKAIDISRGNLSIQIKTMQEAEYVSVEKKFQNNKPQTTIYLTKKGRLAFKNYLKEVEEIIQVLK